MSATHVRRCAILNPLSDGHVAFHRDGALAFESGTITFVGDADDYTRQGGDLTGAQRVPGLLMPPMLDVHTHVQQWPIRGEFLKDVASDSPGGQLLAGLDKNVFPAEMRFADERYAAAVIAQFRDDALAHGVVGGCVFMTIHAAAAQLAFELLGDDWLIGPVLMDQQCPPALRNDVATVLGPFEKLAAQYGPRTVLADRFAVSCSSALRRAGVDVARRHGLRMQTHLNEQLLETGLVRQLYPRSRTYAGVYEQDGLLAREPIVAHCIHMADEEWQLLRDRGAAVAHCPTSNALLGSGVMSLDEIRQWEVPFALATDVGASPSTSLLAEARQFLLVHDEVATPAEAMWRITVAPAQILRCGDRFGTLRRGGPASFVMIDVEPALTTGQTIRRMLGWQPPCDEVTVALAELRTGAADRTTLNILMADFQAAASRVPAITQVVLNGVERFTTASH